HDPRDRAVVGTGLAAEDVRADDPRLVLAGVREQRDTGHVACSPDAVSGPAALVHPDLAALAGLDSHCLEADAVASRLAPGRDDELAAAQLAAVVECDHAVVALAAHLLGRAAHVELDPLA